MLDSSDHLETTQSLGSDDFVVLPENRFAYGAFTQPRDDTSPSFLYLYGPAGVGKSLLLKQAILSRLAADAGCRFKLVTASNFAAEFAEAAERKAIADFQKVYRALDLCLIEDIHALERRPETQKQLLSLADALNARGAELIVTARKPPSELAEFPRKLTNRFQGGILASIKPYNVASRERLLEHFGTLQGLDIPHDVARLLARKNPTSPRELKGLVLQLKNIAKLRKRQIDLKFTQDFLKDATPLRQVTLSEISRTVARHFNVPLTQLRSRNRAQNLALPRQCAMFLARELTSDGLSQIGRYFSNRDHSTVIHSCTRIATLLPDQPELRQHLAQIRHLLGAE